MIKNHLINDLIWAVKSPPLIVMPEKSCLWYDNNFYLDLYHSSEEWFSALSNNPEKVQSLVDAQKDKRLGKLFETLWAAYLDDSDRFEIIEQNLQIIDGDKTLGELDLIVIDQQTKKMLHWELAVKFYLGVGDTRQWKNWFGPAKKDRLDLKMNHLINHQTTLCQHEVTKKVLRSKNIKIDQSAVIMKGCLFYPDKSKKNEPPEYASVDHCRSRWVRLSDCEGSLSKEAVYCPLIGEGWMAGLTSKHYKETFSLAEMIERMNKRLYRLPLLISVVIQGVEREKLFIVQDDWHNQ